MAAREHGDMPLGSRPFLPQFADSRPVARPKRQIFQAGGEIREPEAEAFDPSAHVSLVPALAASAATVGRLGWYDSAWLRCPRGTARCEACGGRGGALSDPLWRATLCCMVRAGLPAPAP